jgi:hypothetical protein
MYFQFPTVEECDFDRKFLFDEYMAISHRYGLKKYIIEKLNNSSFVLCLHTMNCLVKFVMHNSLLNFHSVFFETPCTDQDGKSEIQSRVPRLLLINRSRAMTMT